MPGSRTPNEDSHLAFATAAYEQVLASFDSSQVDRFFAPSYIQHSSLAAAGLPALKVFLDRAKQDYPQAETRIKRAFVDGDMVIFHVHVVLRPGEAGLAVVDMFRLQDGMLAEHWDVIQPVPADPLNQNGVF
jgi:predicted SnoaL-like aldol condensation-catalyzing enzyme